MLKQIPTEEAFNKDIRLQTGKRKRKRTAPPPPKLQKQHVMEINDKDGKLKTVCLKLVRYIKKGKEHSTEEMTEMIHTMRNGLLCLEKQRQKNIWKKKK